MMRMKSIRKYLSLNFINEFDLFEAITFLLLLMHQFLHPQRTLSGVYQRYCSIRGYEKADSGVKTDRTAGR